MGRLMMVAIVVFGCGDQRRGLPIDASIDAPPDAVPQLTCTTGHEDKIKFDYATSCGNDGSVEFCIPDSDPAVMTAVAAISSTITCAPGGGRANCFATPGLLLCTYPTLYPEQCLSYYGAMTADVWSDMCQIAALPQVTEIVRTILE
jgi:hypothetical protein